MSHSTQLSGSAPVEPLALVTFCNAVASPESLVALVNLATGNVREIGFDYQLTDYGATGVTYLPDGSLVIGLSGSRRLIRLSPEFTVGSQYGDDALEDVHSLAVRDDSLFAAATGKDALLEYRIEADNLVPLAAHRLSEADSDTAHVNSVCIHQGRVLISMFGQAWRDHPVGSPTGAIIDLADRSVVSDSLTHPHTLVSSEDRLYVLGSFSGTVEQVHPSGERSLCAQYPGYLRGMAFFEQGALVGVSGRRRRSRGLGTLNVAGPEFDQRCGVIWFSPQWDVAQFTDLSWFGREIFDVTIVKGSPELPTVADSFAAARHRSRQLDRSWEAPPEGPLPPDAPIG